MHTPSDFQDLVESFEILRGILCFLAFVYLTPVLVFLTGGVVWLLGALTDRLFDAD